MNNSELSAVSALAPFLGEKCMLLDEHRAKAVLARVAEAVRSAASTPAEARIRVVEPREEPSYTPIGQGVACIPIVGVLTKYASWWDECCGFCATNSLMEQLAEAVDDESITAITLDIDCPGGFVNGTVEFADAVSAANKIKPVTAIVRGMCCSGAYWVASQAGAIISRPESEVGNIGVYSVLTDVSKFYDSIGVSMTLVASGQFKGMGADGKVSEDLIKDTQRIINGLCQQFIGAIAAGRGLDRDRAAELADGRSYLGPQAKQLGLVDSIASSFDAAIQAVIGDSGGLDRAAAAPGTESSMKKTDPAAPAAAKGDSAPPDKKNVHGTLNDTITSANKHRDQARAAMDSAGSYAEDVGDDTMDLAKQCVAALNSSAEESKRAAKAWQSKIDAGSDDDEEQPSEETGGNGDSDDTAGDDDEETAAEATPPKKAGKPAAASELLAAFPDDKAFCMDQLGAEASMEAAHAAYSQMLSGKLAALAKENDKLKVAAEGQAAVGFDGTRDHEGTEAAAGEEPDAIAKAEWKANKNACREKYLNEKVYVNVRRRELA
jgi:signal peptide peptidase SppA